MEEGNDREAIRLERVDSPGCELEENEVSADSNEAASNNQKENGEVGVTASINLNVGEGIQDDERAVCITPLQCDPIPLPLQNVEIENNVVPPKVGMVFVGWLEVEAYYRSYGKQVGFGITRVKAAYKGGKSKEKRSTTWRCECSGKPDMRRVRNGKKISKGLEVGGVLPRITDSLVGVRAPRRSKKCDCPAMIYASVNSQGEWVIRTVVLEHKNHIPNPSLSNCISQNRQPGMTACKRRKSFNDQDLGSERDGVEEMPFTQRDVQNVITKERRLKLRDGDANTIMAFIEKMQKVNQNFFHSHRYDEHGVLQDVFWVDARCKAAFEEFGDVVCFDTTYLTNEYELPLVNFVGVNHHGQTILLGCALLSHEDTVTFQWVFRTWLLCMGGKAPPVMLTDQTSVIGEALAAVMPTTRHRWCLWHIIQKLGNKLGRFDRYTQFKEELKNVIYDCLTAEEFQSQWSRVIEEYHLQSSEWLTQMYGEREMWVPAYMKHLFCAGMRTTQRVENIHSFFDEYVGRHTRLSEFTGKYCVAMEQRASMERDADANTARYVRGLATGFKVEKIFQKMYTDAKFAEVQRECARVLYCTGRGETWVTETEVDHLMEDRVWVVCKSSKTEIPSTKRRLYRVRFNTETSEVSCDCRLFESCGIMCRHIIKVYDMNLIEDVPEKYILRRWRKDIPRKYARVKVAYHDPSKTVEVIRFDKMMSAFELVCGNAMQMEEAMQVVINMVRAMDINVNECLGKISMSSVGQCQTMNVLQTPPSTGTVKFAGDAEIRSAETGSGTDAARDPLFTKWNRTVQSTSITEKSAQNSEQLVSEASVLEHDDDVDDDEGRKRKFEVMKKKKLDVVYSPQVIQVQPSAMHGECQGQQQELMSPGGMRLMEEAGPASYFTRNIDQEELGKEDDNIEHNMEPRSMGVAEIGGEGGPAAYLTRNIAAKNDMLQWNRISWE
ncbi:protein FAR1-RELATED SEQUENCE 6 isoform X2 [Spinacia oleracea]|nr:protein FAR1-RELATED SEQUENCE 6-like isoform X2 [Spinacia oleracea]